MLPMWAGTSCWVSFKYEKLSLFCFPCGRIFHGLAGCPADPKEVPRIGGEKASWGMWLRADDYKHFPSGSHGVWSRRSNRGGQNFSAADDTE